MIQVIQTHIEQFHHFVLMSLDVEELLLQHGLLGLHVGQRLFERGEDRVVGEEDAVGGAHFSRHIDERGGLFLQFRVPPLQRLLQRAFLLVYMIRS